jgi:superfamily II DNA or RNA helicase
MNNQEKGLQYEKYVRDFIIHDLGKNAYLWNECPENILIENALIDSHNDMRLLRKDVKEGHLHSHKDIGIDIIQIEKSKCSIVQCKNGYTNGLCVDDIGGIMMRSNFMRDTNTFIYYTNCLSRNIRFTASLSPYVVSVCANKLEVSDEKKIYFVKLPYEASDKTVQKPEIIPYSYQTEAFVKFRQHFQNNHRGILSLPCGCGKTYTSYLISSDYSHIIILSPLREFASQNLNRFIEYGYDKDKTLLVDSDGNRDIENIKDMINAENKLLVSCTYKSMDLVSECLDLFKDALFIVDEFHNLSKANISDDENNIFKLLMSDHRILFMSATPRIYDIEYDDESFDMEWLFGDIVYQMTFTDAIANKYITDYRIWLPSIHENNEDLDKELSIYEIDDKMKNRCKFLYSCIANNGSRKCIVYCKDSKDMNAMIECMEILNKFYIMDIEINSISCEDGENKRKHTLECFTNANDKIQLLFNIRILNECIDIPACDSIYISYAPKNKITTIQRISRSTRTDKNNPYKTANIYIWCEAYEEILETLSSIKEYDIMFKNKIKINAVDFYHSRENKKIEMVENDLRLLSGCIIGVKEFKCYKWEEKLQMVEDYIKEHGKLPYVSNKIKKYKQLGSWIHDQKHHYANYTKGMKKIDIRLLWENFVEKHHKLFRIKYEVWEDNLQEAKKYIQDYNKLPSTCDKDDTILKLGLWICRQKQNYDRHENIMKIEKIRKMWYEFVEYNSLLFRTNEESWNAKLTELSNYIEKNKKLPSNSDKDDTIRNLAIWIQIQKKNYEKQEFNMKNKEIHDKWKQFITDYSYLFMSRDEVWHDRFDTIIKHIENNNILPSRSSADAEIKSMAAWIQAQKQHYSNRTGLMNVDEIRLIWEKFIDKYHKYKTNKDKWFENFEAIKEYVKQNNHLPSNENTKDKNVQKLGNWLNEQKQNHKNRTQRFKDDRMFEIWDKFVKDNYELFKTNEEVWLENFDRLKVYIHKNNKLPSKKAKNEDKNIGLWVCHQKQIYRKNEDIMKNNDIRRIWEEFVTDNSILFRTNEELWNAKLDELIVYIETNNALPSTCDQDESTDALKNWMRRQNQNYVNKQDIMKHEEYRKKWEKLTTKYDQLFMTREEYWRSKLNKLIEYIDSHQKLPSIYDTDQTVKSLARFMYNQRQLYKTQNKIMKDVLIRKEWDIFNDKYSQFIN